MNPSEAEERDAALIDRLYGDATDAELDELRTVRALVARVREEAPVVEPSPAIAAALLQAARARAPEVTPGVWARLRRWFLPIAAHPALAAAATVVVVAGAAALWMRDGGQVAEPTRDEGMVETRSIDPVEPPAPAMEPGPAPAPELAEPMAPPAEEVAVPEKPARKATGRGREAERQAAKEDVPAGAGDAPAVVVTGQVDGVVGGAGRDEAKKVEAPPPPPPAPEPTVQGSVATEQVLSDEGGASSSSVEQARAVTRRARAEAEKNNCKNTASFATEVRNLDRGIYDKEFVRDRAIDACLRRDRAKSTSGE